MSRERNWDAQESAGVSRNGESWSTSVGVLPKPRAVKVCVQNRAPNEVQWRGGEVLWWSSIKTDVGNPVECPQRMAGWECKQEHKERRGAAHLPREPPGRKQKELVGLKRGPHSRVWA